MSADRRVRFDWRRPAAAYVAVGAAEPRPSVSAPTTKEMAEMLDRLLTVLGDQAVAGRLAAATPDEAARWLLDRAIAGDPLAGVVVGWVWGQASDDETTGAVAAQLDQVLIGLGLHGVASMVRTRQDWATAAAITLRRLRDRMVERG